METITIVILSSIIAFAVGYFLSRFVLRLRMENAMKTVTGKAGIGKLSKHFTHTLLVELGYFYI